MLAYVLHRLGQTMRTVAFPLAHFSSLVIPGMQEKLLVSVHHTVRRFERERTYSRFLVIEIEK